MKLLYLHGLDSKPGGIKPTFLRQQGHEIINPALPNEDMDRSVRIALSAYDESRPEIIVGSSRGGAVAMGLDSGLTPLVLIAPAWKRWGTAQTVKAGTIILHSQHDEVIPIEDSRELVRASGLPGSALVVVGRDHNMIDEVALRALLEAIERVGQSTHNRDRG
jgi:predicted peptidase